MEQVCNLVMLIDDDMIDNFITGRIINVTGFSKGIVIKNTVREALLYLTDNQDNEELLPEIIFLDLNMPLHDGFYFLKEFENLSGGVRLKSKIIVLSSSDNKPDIERILTIDQVVKFITKPISEEVLEEIHLKKANF